MKKKSVKGARDVSSKNNSIIGVGRLRSVPEDLNIIWGKKYSLKDKSPTVALVLFLFLVICVLSFLSVMKKDENSVENKGESSDFIGEIVEPCSNNLYIHTDSDVYHNDVLWSAHR